MSLRVNRCVEMQAVREEGRQAAQFDRFFDDIINSILGTKVQIDCFASTLQHFAHMKNY